MLMLRCHNPGVRILCRPILPLATPMAPLVLFLMAATILAWGRRPGSVLTWATLPYVVVLSLTPHKEDRFLFPLVPFLRATSRVSSRASVRRYRDIAVPLFCSISPEQPAVECPIGHSSAGCSREMARR